ncbi:lactadherin-like [Patiria miniata]|uniref:F5/8 type C domain-containing protein n=1 Tax=Patiria miniata TaxID=46514 RepID=A0A914AC92_PATMI|nr:lactadherin-like [Patiria miniata]
MVKEPTPAGHTTMGKEPTTAGHHATMGKEPTPAGHTTMRKETTPSGHTTMGKEPTPAGHTTMGKESTPASHTTMGKKSTLAAECLHPLGMEDGTIPDDRITASSKLTPAFPASMARLNQADFAWLPDVNANSWIEVDFGECRNVSGITTQGWQLESETRWTTNYKVKYQEKASSNYEYVKHGNGYAVEFVGNTDGTSPVTNMFDGSVVATLVRIEPTQWNYGVALRLELLGCHRD